MIEGRTLVLSEDYFTWCKSTPELLTITGHHYAATIYDGVFDRPYGYEGFTLAWTDELSTWAEFYGDLATTFARLAALDFAVDQGLAFRDSAECFPRWSQNFFERTVSGSIVPAKKK